MDLTEKDIERFLSKIDKNSSPNGCWIWTAHLSINGYPRFRLNKKTLEGHRLSYFIFKDNIFPDKNYICHTCDNPSCVNPEHLFAGTNQDNMTDRNNKNRQWKPIGSKHPRALIDEEDVKEIKKLLKCGMTHKNIAKKFNVKISLISDISCKRTWIHVTD